MHSQLIETKLQAQADATARIMVIVDSRGTVSLLSKFAQQRLNLQVGIPLGSQLSKLWQGVQVVIDQCLQGHEFQLEIDGLEYLVGVNPLIENGDVGGAVCVLVDGIQLDTMARQLPSFKTLSRELDTIIDSSSDGLFVCDANATVIRMNPASEKIHNSSAEQIVGQNMRDLLANGFIDRSAALEATISKKQVSLLQNKAGRKLISIATPVLDEFGEVVRIVVSERDITEIDNLQLELEKQQGFKDGFREQMLAMQQIELDSQKIIARSPVMIRSLKHAIKVAPTDSSVLILGESGVGKGLIADLIHKNSPRSKQPLIKINCGAIPESLIEAELFGYEKGAFTGALAGGKPGHFELADQGTLFLDEVAELPLSSQVKLLHFLEDGQITRLGETRCRTVNVRVLAATNRDLEKMVEQGMFRLDLYYRLNVIPIQVPAIRERTDCIVPLIRHYIDVFNHQVGTHKRLTRAALDVLTVYSYPGNVRELMNICERLVVMAETDLIDLADLPHQIAVQPVEEQFLSERLAVGVSLQQTLETVEKKVLEKALQQYRNQSEIATALGVNQSTIARKLKKFGLV